MLLSLEDDGFTIVRSVPVLLLATLLSYPAGIALGNRWLLPLLNAAPAYFVMVRLLRQGKRREAVFAMLLWGAALAVLGTCYFILWPGVPAELVINGAQYRDEMFRWIQTGYGREGSIRLFLPQHLLQILLFTVLSLGTASTLSLYMGAVLMNSMAYYVASLERMGVPVRAVILLGWQPWALCRIAAFCTAGVILAEPVLSRLLRYAYPGLAKARGYLLWASAGIVMDWALKALLAPVWGIWLRHFLP